jgi:LysM repeat protein
MEGRGWDDIGQHITIGKDGDVVTGRDIQKVPCSATGHNGNSNLHPFMYEMIGNFDAGNDKLEGKQLETATKISNYFYKKGKDVGFHREQLLPNGKVPKTCPGTGVDKNWFMGLVKNVGTTPAPVPTPTKSYTVVKGDTFYGIAKKVGISVDDLKKFNPRVNPDKLQIGDVIYLYAVPVTPTPVVKPVAPKPVPPKTSYPNDLPLTVGSKGNSVKSVQRFLGITADGIFGNGTKAAVIKYQKMRGITADGIVGKQTWDNMF